MIEDYGFGVMTIKNKKYTSDLLIHQGKVLPDWWRSSGHQCDLDDLKPILADKPEVLVLGTGSSGMMRPTPALRDYLKNENIQLIAMPTDKAVAEFNQLQAKGVAVSGGFHLTC